MKLPIKKEYADLIKAGLKEWELRDAHITFTVEETGEVFVCDIIDAKIKTGVNKLFPDVLEDENTLGLKIKLRGLNDCS